MAAAGANALARQAAQPLTPTLAERVLSAAGGLRAGLAAEGPLPSRRDIRDAGRRAAGGAVPRVAPAWAPTAGSLREHVAGTIGVAGAAAGAGDLPGPAPPARRAAAPTAAASGARGDHRASCWRRCPTCARVLAKDVLAAFDSRSGGQRHRRDRRLLPGPVRDRDLPRREPAAGARRRGRAAHADRVRALAHRHRHPPGRDDRRVVLHRSRHRHRHRRDQPHRRPRAHLPGRDAGRAVGAPPQPAPTRRRASSATRPSRTTSRSTPTPPSWAATP